MQDNNRVTINNKERKIHGIRTIVQVTLTSRLCAVSLLVEKVYVIRGFIFTEP